MSKIVLFGAANTVPSAVWEKTNSRAKLAIWIAGFNNAAEVKAQPALNGVSFKASRATAEAVAKAGFRLYAMGDAVDHYLAVRSTGVEIV